MFPSASVRPFRGHIVSILLSRFHDRWETEVDNVTTARYWMIVVGVALLGAGLLGFVAGNPIASSDPNAIFRVNAAHNVVHIISGLLALGIGYGLRGETLANATIGFGVLYALVFALLVIDPSLFGLFGDAPANAADHVLHLAIAVVSVAVGYMARERTVNRPQRA
jgi:hypothetical protein